jgi:hypothetical protein
MLSVAITASRLNIASLMSAPHAVPKTTRLTVYLPILADFHFEPAL